MKPVNQTRYGWPHGNCFAACVASILERDLSGVPDLDDQRDDEMNWLDWFNTHLKGASIFCAEVKPDYPFAGYIPKGSYYIASGPARLDEKYLHSIVMISCGGAEGETDQLAHDPHPPGKRTEAEIATGIVEIRSICLVLWEPDNVGDELTVALKQLGRDGLNAVLSDAGFYRE